MWKTQQWPQDWKRSILIPIPKKSSTKECSNHRTIALISHASKVLHARLQHDVNQEYADVHAGFRKGRETIDWTANIHCIIGKQGNSRKTSTSFLLTIPKPLTVWILTNCGRSYRDGNTRPSYLSSERPVCGSRTNSQNPVWNNWLVQDWEKSMTELSSVTVCLTYTLTT